MKLYSINISDLSDSEISEWFNVMSDERMKEVEKLLVPKKQKLKIAADYLCRKAVADFCGVSPEKIRFSRGEYGKPYAVGLDVHFSISHSGNYAVCAVSDKEIGVDIERIREINPRIPEKFACDKEAEYIASHKNGLFEIWTLKEAYFKCIGTGLGADIKNVSFDVTENVVLCSKNGFECCFYDIDENYICSVCEKIN